MKLATTIQARKDGTVRVAGINGKPYVFEVDAEAGVLTCDVDDDATVIHLLDKQDGFFHPVDPEDYELAERMIEDARSMVPPPDGGTGPDDEDDDKDENDGQQIAPGSNGGLPVEAGTKPKRAPGKGKRLKPTA